MSAGGEHINYKELYEATLQMNQQLLKSNEALQSQLLTVQHQLQQLTKLLKGFKSERFVPSSLRNSKMSWDWFLKKQQPAPS